MNTIKIDGLANVLKAVDPKRLHSTTKKALQQFGRQAVTSAKRKAPVDEGLLRNSIEADTKDLENLEISILANANYAPYIEFGTRKFAEKYVNTLPAEWQDVAAQYKGKASGDFFDLLLAIVAWMHRKGIAAGTYSVKTKRRLGSKSQKEQEDLNLAYRIALKILKEGIPAHPYLYPAVSENIDGVTKYIEDIYGRP